MRIRNFRDLDLTYFDAEDLYAIEMKASVLSFDDCLSFLCVPLSDIPPKELIIAKRVHAKGRMKAVNTAADKLFSQMSGRGGGAVALDYLKQMSSTFSLEATPDPKSKSGFTFNVVMPEDDHKDRYKDQRLTQK